MTAESAVQRPLGQRAIPRLRWILASILLLVSIVNYLDRQALSILATTIQAELSISNAQYALIVQCFLLAYTAMHLLGGRLVDRLGTRIAESVFIVWWSTANILTSLASGFYSLAAFRTLLGLGEPGHYSASGKAVSEWFPSNEKGIAVGMYTMGGTLGAALAGPLLAFLTIHYGWRMAFVVTGCLGFIPAALWWFLYRRPAEHARLGDAERSLLDRAGLLARTATKKSAVPWSDLLRFRPLWLVMGARMITDPLWYFYLFWFPKYLQEVRGFTLAEVGATVWIVYLSADAGCLLGGWLSGILVRRGVAPVTARLRIMTVAAAVLALSFTLPLLPGRLAMFAMASLFTCAEMVWMTNCVTLPIDIFPSRTVGSVQGTIGAGGSLGGFLSTGAVGYMVTHFSYQPTFSAMSLLHPAAIAVMLLLLPASVSHFQRTFRINDSN